MARGGEGWGLSSPKGQVAGSNPAGVTRASLLCWFRVLSIRFGSWSSDVRLLAPLADVFAARSPGGFEAEPGANPRPSSPAPSVPPEAVSLPVDNSCLSGCNGRMAGPVRIYFVGPRCERRRLGPIFGGSFRGSPLVLASGRENFLSQVVED